MQLQVFKHQNQGETLFNEVRSFEKDGEIWFVASDITNNLGYTNGRKAVSDHCRKAGVTKRYISSPSGSKSTTLINEGNVYRLIIRSRLPASEAFEAWLFDTVIPQIRKTGSYGDIKRYELPNFIQRYKDNISKIPYTHYSVISEMFTTMYSALEKVGYSIPDTNDKGNKIMPDISVGRVFSDFLKKNNSEYRDQRQRYEHAFPDGRVVGAYMYPIESLPIFHRFIHEVWIPKYASNYFKKADPKALDYLPKLIG